MLPSRLVLDSSANSMNIGQRSNESSGIDRAIHNKIHTIHLPRSRMEPPVTAWSPDLLADGPPRYLQIADQIEAGIRSGTLKPGDKLPPQRRLAARLGIDFTTVSRAYAEAASRRLTDSHVGRGTFVRKSVRATETADPRRMGDEDLSMNMPPEVTDPELLAFMREGWTWCRQT